MTRFLWLFFFAALFGCSGFTDAATRLAFDLEAGVKRLGREEGASYTLQHVTPSKAGECSGPFRVQFDRVGALIIWCKDDRGETLTSHSTSYHSRFVETTLTFIVDKPAGSPLLVHLERRNGRPHIVDVR